MLEPGGYAAFYQGTFGFDIGASDPEVYLSAFDAEGRLLGYIAGIGVDAAEENVSMGRHDGESVDFVPLASPTFGVDAPATVEEFRGGTGAPNAPPKVGPIVINEIMYHPADDESEFIELHNISGSAIALHESASRAWEIDGIRNTLETADFRFPQGASIPPGGYALVVAGSPDAFRTEQRIPAEVPIFGPFGGGLANEGERLRLFKPAGASLLFGSRVLVDLVRYDDSAPWDEDPDGEGPSLERIRTMSYGNESANWAASTVDDGTPGARNTVHEPEVLGGLQLPGDCNQDATIDISDGVCLLRHLFVGSSTPLPCGGGATEGG
ncbi:MAG: lamin tail domain-containing protein, partial [Actinobacteria bacterium]|nr:lamin tail domain-containing protein [Actinomycetota bacterium]